MIFIPKQAFVKAPLKTGRGISQLLLTYLRHLFLRDSWGQDVFSVSFVALYF